MKATITVKLKTWGEMVKEYGLSANGDIMCEHTFIKHMKPLAGAEVEVYKDTSSSNSKLVLKTVVNKWSISRDMITTNSLFEHKLL